MGDSLRHLMIHRYKYNDEAGQSLRNIACSQAYGMLKIYIICLDDFNQGADSWQGFPFSQNCPFRCLL